MKVLLLLRKLKLINQIHQVKILKYQFSTDVMNLGLLSPWNHQLFIRKTKYAQLGSEMPKYIEDPSSDSSETYN